MRNHAPSAPLHTCDDPPSVRNRRRCFVCVSEKLGVGWGGRWRWNRSGMIEGGVGTSLAAVELAKIEEKALFRAKTFVIVRCSLAHGGIVLKTKLDASCGRAPPPLDCAGGGNSPQPEIARGEIFHSFSERHEKGKVLLYRNCPRYR